MQGFQPKLDLELDAGERLLRTSHRHWIVLLQRSFAFALTGGLALGLALYRSVGGTFLAAGVDQTGRIDAVNALLGAPAIILLVIWWFQSRRSPQPVRATLLLLGVGLPALAIFFRFQGDQLLYIDPLNPRGGDLLNLFLLAVSFVMLAIIAYIVIDWANDYLILTTTRVVYEDRQEVPLIGVILSNIQQQILIDDIQQVNVRQESYFEYVLYQLFGRFGFQRYGAVILRSFSPRRLVFEFATDPMEMQRAILRSVHLGRVDLRRLPA
jgi:hypothetical protein